MVHTVSLLRWHGSKDPGPTEMARWVNCFLGSSNLGRLPSEKEAVWSRVCDFCHQVCLCYFSVAVLRHHDQGNLDNKVYLGLMVSED